MPLNKSPVDPDEFFNFSGLNRFTHNTLMVSIESALQLSNQEMVPVTGVSKHTQAFPPPIQPMLRLMADVDMKL
ncbi:hypothetical protein [Neptunomonas antarctica]|uniref:Uncharacterized protein n=1 Tax=Neptunomonas antarctica TaxID=619304 RepID=A0A1N7J1W4_9GAMM|nr:hypothetical protein [Neptunomonas antarctica]SIS43211.1 hypothetical protein SAMN05421760_101472 [Neptunomonas antarctica]